MLERPRAQGKRRPSYRCTPGPAHTSALVPQEPGSAAFAPVCGHVTPSRWFAGGIVVCARVRSREGVEAQEPGRRCPPIPLRDSEGGPSGTGTGLGSLSGNRWRTFFFKSPSYSLLGVDLSRAAG